MEKKKKRKKVKPKTDKDGKDIQMESKPKPKKKSGSTYDYYRKWDKFDVVSYLQCEELWPERLHVNLDVHEGIQCNTSIFLFGQVNLCPENASSSFVCQESVLFNSIAHRDT